MSQPLVCLFAAVGWDKTVHDKLGASPSGGMMKKFISIIVALALLISMLTLTTFAFAEDNGGEGSGTPTEPSRSVTFNDAAFRKYVIDALDDENVAQGNSFWVEMSRTFSLENKWWEDAAKVHEIFEGINYRYQPVEDTEDKKDEFVVHYDYANPTEGDPYTEADALEDGSYKETAHFKLPDAPVAATHKESVDGEEKDVPNAYFAGWQIESAEELPVHLQGVFAAGTSIAMPASNITVKAVWKATEEEAKSELVPDDKLYMIYVSPSGSDTEDMDKWSSVAVTSTINLTTQGAWSFRFVVIDGAKASESGYSYDFDDMLATTYDNILALIGEGGHSDEELTAANCTLRYNAEDTTAPEFDLSTTQKNKVDEGLTVGTTYSISTSLEIEDCSATSSNVTYKVYKKVGTDVDGADSAGWLLILDSEKREVTEGYENCITSSGVITPLAEDVTGDKIYKIIYSIKDPVSGKEGVRPASAGETQTGVYNPEMLLEVKPNLNSGSAKSIEVWKIVLYVIAGLSAVGIIVLLCIKPKEQKTDARYNAGSANNTDGTAVESKAEETDSPNDKKE